MSLSKILQELRSWRETPSQRERISARPLDQEIPDPVPRALPVGYEAPPTMEEMIQRYVRLEVSQAASAQDMGTFEQEDDFTADEADQDDFLPLGQFDISELEMEPDPEMPETAPVEDPPSGVDSPAVPSASEQTASEAVPFQSEGSMLTSDPSVPT